MRVRITKRLTDSIDGIQLDRFIPGLVYDVGTVLGNYLLAEHAAVPVGDAVPALVVPIDHYVPVKFHQVVSEAHDKPRKRRIS